MISCSISFSDTSVLLLLDLFVGFRILLHNLISVDINQYIYFFLEGDIVSCTLLLLLLCTICRRMHKN